MENENGISHTDLHQTTLLDQFVGLGNGKWDLGQKKLKGHERT